MRFIHAATAFAVALTAAGCAPSEAPLDTDDQKASYAIGLDMGSQLTPAASLLDVDAFVRGVEDALAEAEPAIDPAEVQPILMAFSERVREQQMRDNEAESARNREEGEAYLAENGAREGVTTTESGLQYEVLRAGDGPTPAATDQVSIHYRGTLVDGTEFDSSYGDDPATFAVGGVIQGFTEALLLMPVGSQFRVVIPSDLAYGAQDTGGAIGPNATLIFEIELLEIVGG